MSAVNVFAHSQRAVLLTDSSLYDSEGTIIAFANKAYPVDSWNGAITGRGNWWGPTHVSALAETFASFDEFLTRSGPAIELAHQAALAGGELAGQTFIEVHAIGWSEQRDRAEAYVLKSPNPLKDADEPDYVWVSLYDEEDGVFHHELTARERWMLHRQGAEPGEDFGPENFDPVRHGIPLMDMQRRRGVDDRLGSLAGRYVIGGDLWLTVVDREGVRQGVIHTWPDKVGQLIRPKPLDEASLRQIAPAGDPTPFPVLVASIAQGAVHPESLRLLDATLFKAIAAKHRGDLGPGAPMSRQQRRAAEAQAKKVRAHA